MMSNSLTWQPSSLSQSSMSPPPQGLLSSSPSSSVSSTDCSTKHPIRRVTHACDFCSYRKRRCDGEQPCANCVRRGRKCEYARPIYKRGPHHANQIAANAEKEKNKKERRQSMNDSASEEGDEDNEQEEYKQKLKENREDREHRRSPLNAMDSIPQIHQHSNHSVLLQPNGHGGHVNISVVEGDGRNAMEEEAVALTLALALPTWKYPNLKNGHSGVMHYSNAGQHSGKTNKTFAAPLPLANAAASTSSAVSAALIPACSSTSALPLCTPAPSKPPARLPLPLSPPSSSSSSSTSSFSPPLAAVQLATPNHFAISAAGHSPAPNTPPPPSSVNTSPAQSPAGSAVSSPDGVTPAQSHTPPPSAVLPPHTSTAAVAAAAAMAPRVNPTASPRKRRHAQLMAELRSTVVAADSQLGQKGAMDIAGEKETIEAAIHCIQRLMYLKQAKPSPHQANPQPRHHQQLHAHHNYVYPAQALPGLMPITAPPHAAVSLHSAASFASPAVTPRFPAQMLGGYVGAPYSHTMPIQTHQHQHQHQHQLQQHHTLLAHRQYVQAVSDEEWWSGSGSERGEVEVDVDDDDDSEVRHRRNGKHLDDGEETEDENDKEDEELDRKKKQRFDISRHRSSTSSMEMAMSECA